MPNVCRAARSRWTTAGTSWSSGSPKQTSTSKVETERMRWQTKFWRWALSKWSKLFFQMTAAKLSFPNWYVSRLPAERLSWTSRWSCLTWRSSSKMWRGSWREPTRTGGSWSARWLWWWKCFSGKNFHWLCSDIAIFVFLSYTNQNYMLVCTIIRNTGKSSLIQRPDYLFVFSAYQLWLLWRTRLSCWTRWEMPKTLLTAACIK